jgi:sugar transferase (PEP-CTERM/EpsH1 system associated)
MRILWLKTELLHPVDKGGRIRTYNMLRELKQKHHITYCALHEASVTDEQIKQAYEYCHHLELVNHKLTPKYSKLFYLELVANSLSHLPYYIQKYDSKPMRDRVQSLIKNGSYDILICDFLQSSINVPSSADIRKILFQHNVESQIWERHFKVRKDVFGKAYFYLQWIKSRRYERIECKKYDKVIAVSSNDANILKRDYGVASVSYVPTGVDTGYFQRSTDYSSKEFDMIFMGSMDWLPNIDAVTFFISEILPQVRKAKPDAKFAIVGRNPPPAIIRLTQDDPNIVVTGRVADVRPYLEAASVFVVPLRIGGGTRLKIYEAMAMEMPVISTTVGAEGLPLRPDREIVIADDPALFAASTVKLLIDKELAGNIASVGAEAVRRHFSWQRVATEFATLCTQ